jgi:hypothetical protein
LLPLALAVTTLNGCAALRGHPDGGASPQPDTAVVQADSAPPKDADASPPARPGPIEALAQQTDAGAARVRDGIAAGLRRTRDGVETAMDSPVVTCLCFPVGLAAFILRGGSTSGGASSP